MAEDSPIDLYDRRILDALSSEGRLPVSELARRIGLSKTPCQIRLKRLQKDGYITGFRAELDPVKLGREHVAFVEVRLVRTTGSALAEFNDAVRRVPEVEQCHMIAGAFDYLLKVRSGSMRDYRRVLGEVISALPHVASTSTHVSMEAVRDSYATPASGGRR